jgi:presenilin-like A22 family membrane protease
MMRGINCEDGRSNLEVGIMKKSSFATFAFVLLEIRRNESRIFMHHFLIIFDRLLIFLFIFLFFIFLYKKVYENYSGTNN